MRELLPFLIPIVAIVMGFGFGLLALYFKHRERELFYRERMIAIEKGIELPPVPQSILESKSEKKPVSAYLFKGLLLLFIGIGLAIPLELQAGWQHAAWALVPIAIGLAFLVYYFIEKKRLKDEEVKREDNPDAH